MAKKLSSSLRPDTINTVSNGGTGVSTFPLNSVILGNGTDGLQSVLPGTANNVLTSNGTAWVSQSAPISLPSQTSNSGKYLTTDGSTALWSTISSGLVATAIKTASYTASANELVRCNTTTSAFNITFPASPNDGTIIGIIDINNTFATNAITLLANGNTIEDDSVGFMLDVSGTYVSFMYTTSTANWRLLETPSGTSSAFWNGFTGSGNVVLSTSPSLVTPILGTPTSGNLTNCTFPTLNQNTTGTAAGLSITLAIASGGTGLTTVGTAGNVLTSNGTTWSSQPAPISLPSQTGNSGKYLTTDGTSASWVAGSSAGVGSISILTRSAANISVVVSAGLLPILTSKAYGTICVLAVGGLPIYTHNLTTTQVGVN